MPGDNRVLTLRMALTTLTALTALAATTAGAAPGAVQDLRAITAAAESAVSSLAPGVRARAEPPDPRLRLAACGQTLKAGLPPAAKGAKLTVRVACNGPAGWTIAVPVQVETEAKVAVARRALLPGTVLDATDLTVADRRLPGLPDCCARDPAEVVGQRVRRPIAADAPVALDSLEAPPLVRRGEVVTVIAGAPGFEVRANGIAMADARQGDTVRIRHQTSLRIIQARADSRGVVRADR